MPMSGEAMPRPDQTTGQPFAALPLSGFPVGVWWPAFAYYTEWNAGLHEGIAAFSNEWQDFMGRRITADFALLQRLGASRSPDQVWAAYVAFWSRAAEDYSQEFAMTAKLASSLMSRNLAAMQRQPQEAAADIPALKKAA
jgi:hypothetical protein